MKLFAKIAMMASQEKQKAPDCAPEYQGASQAIRSLAEAAQRADLLDLQKSPYLMTKQEAQAALPKWKEQVAPLEQQICSVLASCGPGAPGDEKKALYIQVKRKLVDLQPANSGMYQDLKFLDALDNFVCNRNSSLEYMINTDRQEGDSVFQLVAETARQMSGEVYAAAECERHSPHDMTEEEATAALPQWEQRRDQTLQEMQSLDYQSKSDLDRIKALHKRSYGGGNTYKVQEVDATQKKVNEELALLQDAHDLAKERAADIRKALESHKTIAGERQKTHAAFAENIVHREQERAEAKKPGIVLELLKRYDELFEQSMRLQWAYTGPYADINADAVQYARQQSAVFLADMRNEKEPIDWRIGRLQRKNAEIEEDNRHMEEAKLREVENRRRRSAA